MTEAAKPEPSRPRSAPPVPSAPPADGPLRALFEAEAALIVERRRIAQASATAQASPPTTPPPTGPTADDATARNAMPRVGLAISGGGVRSATFGLGMLRGLARKRLLSRVDYLSTVSGGGFVGAMFGRLVTLVGIEAAQAELARSTSPVLEWLRRNGRYLSPSGARDLGIAMATYLRAIVAIHAETLLLCLPFVLVVLLPHLLVQGFDDFDPAGWPDWVTPWWPIALIMLVLCVPGLMAAYWIARENPDAEHPGLGGAWRDMVIHLLVASAAFTISLLAWPTPGALARGDGGALFVFGSLLALWSGVVGMSYTRLALRRSHESRALAVARLREKLTMGLRLVLLAAVAAALAGALDALSWWLLEALQSGETWVWGGVGIGSAGILLMRALAQPLQLLAEKAHAGTGSDWGPRLLNLGGAVGLLALVLAWMVAAQWFVFAPEPVRAVRDFAPGVRALGLLALTTLWWLLSARNAHMANATSLHGFYRARLTAAYLAIGNEARDLIHGEVSRKGTKASVREVVQGDDTGLTSYKPEACGGPIHLVNVTLNQTRDDASGLYNADRKGTLVTASARALEVGPSDAALLRDCESRDIGTLGRWVAASGAAASPGAGSYTSAGWALLLFFLGVRLGYWLRAPLPPEGETPPRVARGWRRIVKPLMLWSEASASFYGRARPWWYLSDGGHFDNTGVYPLLKRRLDFIILADNGADADYQFADLENLVRKARIDFGAEIEFYTREEAARHFPSVNPSANGAITVLAPEDMADNHSSRGVMMARVRYAPGADGTRAEATLLVIKPNLHDALDLDLLAYAQRHPTFPHETTGDQSFDEAQWESYQRLGEDIGRALDPAWLAQLPGWSRCCAHPMTIAARLTGALPEDAATTGEPLWRRSARATAIGATLGLSASGTLLLAVWQVSEQFRQNIANEQAEAQRLFTEVSRDLRDLDGSCPKVAEHTAVQLMMLRDLRASPRLRPLEREGVSQLIEHVRSECDQRPQPSIDCMQAAQRAAAGVCAVVNRPPTQVGALSYWHPISTRITLASLFGGGAQDTVLASAPPVSTEGGVASVTRSEPARPAPPVLATRGGNAADAGAADAGTARPEAAAPPAPTATPSPISPPSLPTPGATRSAGA
ncbi:MAG: patatin-like phospholipase family protein, partial [Burkholderiaceae bacterium]|nr:patatin-like phospholipase family protein [Burkholderiaceae bacterium]